MPSDLTNPFDLPSDTQERFERELLETRMILQAALRDVGELDKERTDWTFDDLVPERPSAEIPAVSRDYYGESAALIAVTFAVHETYATLFGVREQLAKAFRQTIQGLDNIAALSADPRLITYLRNTSVLNPVHGLAGERSAEIADAVVAVLEQLRPADVASLIRAGHEKLNLRRASAVLEGFYRAKGRGPDGHWLFEAWDTGFDSRQIAKYRIFRALRKPTLLDAEKEALIAEEAERVEDRLRDSRKLLQSQRRGFYGEQNPAPQDFFYRAFSVYVEARSQLALYSGGGDGVSCINWHSSPLDSNGAPTELPPWETPGS